MNNKKNQRLLVYYDNGEKITCEEKFQFFSEETNKNYIVYADTKEDENGYIRLSANIFENIEDGQITDGNLASIVDYDQNGNPITKMIRTFPITTEREWRIIEAIVEAFQQ